jgi:tetrahydromethanopterin S-methyltransferase subunit B
VALAVGSAFALSSLFGNIWFGRLGIVALAIAAFVALRAAWQEVVEARLEGHAHLLAGENRHQELLFETRQSATIVREVLRKRNTVLTETLTSTRTDLAATRAEVIQRNKLIAEQLRVMSTMRGDLAAARIERDGLVGDVAELMNRVERLEESVQASLHTGSAEVLNLPRRVRRPGRSEDWRTDELPSVAEMVQLDVSSPATPVWKQA